MGRTKKTEVAPEPVASATQKPWSLTQADIDATTQLEYAFGTTRCLPPMDVIPEEFWGWAHNKDNNVYTDMADALFCGDPLPAGDVQFNEGFENNPNLMKFIMAHMRSFEPKHEHKIAGVAYLISVIATVTRDQPPQSKATDA